MTPPRITWMETALQGLAFWIGHRRGARIEEGQ
jgi:hypothetical protein